MTGYNHKARYKINLREAVEFAAVASDALDELRKMIHAAETEVLRLNEVIDRQQDEIGDWEEKYSDLEGAQACGCQS